MSFSYQFGANPQIDYIRLLIGDTEEFDGGSPALRKCIFEDAEILAFHSIQTMQFQSGMKYSFSGGANLPSTPAAYLRVAALALDAIASSYTRLMSVKRLLDVELNDPVVLQRAAHAQAEAWRELDDNSGAFAIIEQCHTGWSFLDRFYKQVQRQTAQ